MNPKLSPEVTEALQAAGNNSLSVDGADGQTYVLVNKDVHMRAMDALQAREDEQVIMSGIADMEAGRHYSVDEAFDRIEQKFRERTDSV